MDNERKIYREPKIMTPAARHGKRKLRGAKHSDVPFVANAWLEGMRDSTWCFSCPNSVYYSYMHEMIAPLINRSSVIVSCLAEDPNNLQGFICAEMRAPSVLVIHWVYVKESWRGQGIARELVQLFLDNEKPDTIFYSFKSPFAERNNALFKRLREEHGLVYNPFFTIASLPEGWAGIKGNDAKA